MVLVRCPGCQGLHLIADRLGYFADGGTDIEQLAAARTRLTIPLVASGGAGTTADFAEVFRKADVSGALAASVFHTGAVAIPDLKRCLADAGMEMRL